MLHAVEPLPLLGKRIVILLLSASMSFALSSCGDVEEHNAEHITFQAENLESILGVNQTEVSGKFGIGENGEPEAFIYNGISIKPTYELENNKLLRIQYDFGAETDTAFKFLYEIKTMLEEKYGKSDTYETLPNRIEGLTVDEYLASDTMQYQEYWIDSGVDFAGLVPEEYKNTKRVDLGIGINKLPGDEPTTIVYIGGIVNSINTQKLSD